MALTRTVEREVKKLDQLRGCSEVKVTGLCIDWIWGIRERKKSRAAKQIGFKDLEDINVIYQDEDW